MKTQVILTLSLLLLPTSSFASKIIGNGGSVLVCEVPGPSRLLCPSPPESRPVRPTQLLDFYEAEDNYGLTIQDPGGVTYQEKVINLLARLRKMFPRLTEALEREFENFEAHKRLRPRILLENTNDAFPAVLPLGCEVKQIAIQIPTALPDYPRQPWFTISKDLWDDLDELNRAGLAVHEALYRIGARNGVEHSIGVRYTVGLMFSRELERISDEDWISGLTGARMRAYERQGVNIPLFTGNFSPCDLLPGMKTCNKVEDLRKAEFRYANGMLTDVIYDSPQTIDFVAARDVSVSLKVSAVKFAREYYEDVMVTQGVMELASEVVPDSRTVRLRFDGRIQAKLGHFTGKISPVSFGADLNATAVPSTSTFDELFRAGLLSPESNQPLDKR